MFMVNNKSNVGVNLSINMLTFTDKCFDTRTLLAKRHLVNRAWGVALNTFI